MGDRCLMSWYIRCSVRRVHAGYNQPMVLVFRSPRADVRQLPLPVDAGIGAKVDQNYFAAQAIRR